MIGESWPDSIRDVWSLHLSAEAIRQHRVAVRVEFERAISLLYVHFDGGALLKASLGDLQQLEREPPTTDLSDIEIRTAIVQQSITSYQGPCPCPYSASTCQGHSAYDKPTNQLVYCYTKDVPADMVSSYRATHASSASNDQSHQEPLPINPPHSEGSIVSPE